MKKAIAMLLVILTVVSLSSVAFAWERCERYVNGSQCGGKLVWKVNNGRSIDHDANHTFRGGFLGLGVYPCAYKYYNEYDHFQCPNGHVEDMIIRRVEHSHSDCGK